MVDPTHALSFGSVAASYNRFRPGYPAEAVAWAAGGPPPARVMDIGAGTGILTRALLELGYIAVPVEPDAGMRTELARSTPGTTALAGTAEAVPVPDGAADAALSGQAYHWFDRERAHAEAARFLRQGGTYAAIWNERDEGEAWMAALTELVNGILGGQGVADSAPRLTSFGPCFGPVEAAEFRHGTRHTPDSLVAMLGTRSYYLTASAQRRRTVEAGVRELVATHPDLVGREDFELPYRTLAYRARRR